MFQTRIHGRGGQGVVTAAELLSVAAFRGGRHAQAFPSFGSERTGAPVVAYCRIDERPIRTREPIVVPDALIIQDPTLLRQIDVFAGLAPHGYVVLNTTSSLSAMGLDDFVAEHDPRNIVAVPATDIALRNIGKPVPNAVLLGAYAALTGQVAVEDVEGALAERFSGALFDGNRHAARQAYEYVQSEQGMALR